MLGILEQSEAQNHPGSAWKIDPIIRDGGGRGAGHILPPVSFSDTDSVDRRVFPLWGQSSYFLDLFQSGADTFSDDDSMWTPWRATIFGDDCTAWRYVKEGDYGP